MLASTAASNSKGLPHLRAMLMAPARSTAEGDNTNPTPTAAVLFSSHTSAWYPAVHRSAILKSLPLCDPAGDCCCLLCDCSHASTPMVSGLLLFSIVWYQRLQSKNAGQVLVSAQSIHQVRTASGSTVCACSRLHTVHQLCIAARSNSERLLWDAQQVG